MTWNDLQWINKYNQKREYNELIYDGELNY